MAKTIGILTGGGDVPGLNPAIKALALGAMEMGYRVLGIRRGWSGLLTYNLDEPSTHDYYIRELTRDNVRTIDRTGGTFPHQSAKSWQNLHPRFLERLQVGKAGQRF
jgi:6-phosphofructokinase